MSKIILSTFGKLDPVALDEIISVMKECYDRLMPHDVTIIDLYVFETHSLLKKFLEEEHLKAKVASSPSFEEEFFAMHDAWRGIPRIMLCHERLQRLSELCRIGGIRHEVGHSVLHGSPEFYILPLPSTMIKLGNACGIPRGELINLLYLISIAVKDYEVTRLLYSHGYLEDQVEYAKHILHSTEEDITEWKLAENLPLTKAFYLLSRLKMLACAAPLSVDKRFGNDIKNYMIQSTSHLPYKHSKVLLKLVLEDFASFGTNTFDNVIYASKLAVENILKPCFSGT